MSRNTSPAPLREEDHSFGALLFSSISLVPSSPSISKESLWRVAQVARRLGKYYDKQGNLEKAREMYEIMVNKYKELFWTDSSATIDAVTLLADAYVRSDMDSEAEGLFRRLINGYETVYGLGHVKTLFAINNLGKCYKRQRKMKDAHETFTIVKDGLYEAMMEATNELADVNAHQGKKEEARVMYREVLQHRIKGGGPGMWEVVRKLDMLSVDQAKPEDNQIISQRARSPEKSDEEKKNR